MEFEKKHEKFRSVMKKIGLSIASVILSLLFVVITPIYLFGKFIMLVVDDFYDLGDIGLDYRDVWRRIWEWLR